MAKALRTTTASLLLAGLAACGGSGSSSGSSNGGGRPVPTPSEPAPKSNSIADLAAFAAGGYSYENTRGVDVRTRNYETNGQQRTASLSGTQRVGLLSVAHGDNPRQTHTLIGEDTGRNVKISGNYSAEANGALRVRSGENVERVSGTTSLGISTLSGEWLFGADLWRDSGDSGIYVGIDDGKVEGNTMVFNPRKSVVVEMTPEGVKSTKEKAGVRAVFSNDGQKVFGKINGNNAETGFMVDAGFAGSEYTD